MKSYVPGTPEYKASHGHNTGSGTSSHTTGSHTGRDTAAGKPVFSLHKRNADLVATVELAATLPQTVGLLACVIHQGVKLNL